MVNYTLLGWDTERWETIATVACERELRRIMKKALKMAKRERLNPISFGVLRWPVDWTAERFIDAVAAMPPPGTSPNHVNVTKAKVPSLLPYGRLRDV